VIHLYNAVCHCDTGCYSPARFVDLHLDLQCYLTQAFLPTHLEIVGPASSWIPRDVLVVLEVFALDIYNETTISAVIRNEQTQSTCYGVDLRGLVVERIIAKSRKDYLQKHTISEDECFPLLFLGTPIEPEATQYP